MNCWLFTRQEVPASSGLRAAVLSHIASLLAGGQLWAFLGIYRQRDDVVLLSNSPIHVLNAAQQRVHHQAAEHGALHVPNLQDGWTILWKNIAEGHQFAVIVTERCIKRQLRIQLVDDGHTSEFWNRIHRWRGLLITATNRHLCSDRRGSGECSECGEDGSSQLHSL